VATEKQKARAVVITTDKDKRGVFFGFTAETPGDGESCTLAECRMAVYWSADVRGVVGLAAKGPTKGCRITPAVTRGTIHGCTSVLECSDKAVTAWRAEPWG
jgi:hypothetical protein